MENTITKKQAQAIIMACRHWEDAIQVITNEESFEWYSEWLEHLQSVSFAHTLPVNMRDLYGAMVELCLVLDARIDKGEIK